MNTDTQRKIPMVIGIAGRARSGKDTVADILIKELEGVWEKYSFAAPLKMMLFAGLGLNDKDPAAFEKFDKTYRHMAQTLGTEWGRDMIHPDIWVREAEYRLKRSLCNWIIPDVRFENEAAFVRKYGILIHLKRPAQERIAESDHISEKVLPRQANDWLINNDSSERYLIKVVQQQVVVPLLEDLERLANMGMIGDTDAPPVPIDDWKEPLDITNESTNHYTSWDKAKDTVGVEEVWGMEALSKETKSTCAIKPEEGGQTEEDIYDAVAKHRKDMEKAMLIRPEIVQCDDPTEEDNPFFDGPPPLFPLTGNMLADIGNMHKAIARLTIFKKEVEEDRKDPKE